MWIKAFWGAPWSKGMLLSSEKDLRWLILLAITSPLGTIPILRQHIFGDILTHPPTIELFIPFSFFVLAYEVMKILHNSLLYQFSYFKIFVLPCKMQKWNTLKWKYYNLFLAKNKVIKICYEPDICQHEYGTEGLQKLTFFLKLRIYLPSPIADVIYGWSLIDELMDLWLPPRSPPIQQ